MKPVVAVDLDGTLAKHTSGPYEFDKIGEPFKDAVEFVRRLSTFADVLIYTCRCYEELNKPYKAPLLKNIVKQWLDKHGFPYLDIWIGQGKPVAHAYVDDRAVKCAPSTFIDDGPEVYKDALKRVELLIEG